MADFKIYACENSQRRTERRAHSHAKQLTQQLRAEREVAVAKIKPDNLGNLVKGEADQVTTIGERVQDDGARIRVPPNARDAKTVVQPVEEPVEGVENSSMNKFSIHLLDVGAQNIEEEGTETGLSGVKTSDGRRQEGFEIRHTKKSEVRITRQEKKELMKNGRDAAEEGTKGVFDVADDRARFQDNVLVLGQAICIWQARSPEMRRSTQTMPVATRPEPCTPGRDDHGSRLSGRDIVIMGIKVEERTETKPQIARAADGQLVSTVVDGRDNVRRQK